MMEVTRVVCYWPTCVDPLGRSLSHQRADTFSSNLNLIAEANGKDFHSNIDKVCWSLFLNCATALNEITVLQFYSVLHQMNVIFYHCKINTS